MDQVLPVRGDKGAVVGRQAHRLGLLVAHAVGRVRPRHVARVRLVERHQVELQGQSKRGSSVTPVDSRNRRAAAFGNSEKSVFTHSLRGRTNSFHHVSSYLIGNSRLKPHGTHQQINSPFDAQIFQTGRIYSAAFTSSCGTTLLET